VSGVSATRHKAAINKLCEERGLKSTGLSKALLQLIPADDREEAKDIIRGAIPDAWKIDNGVLEIYEVSDTHRLSTSKVCIYAYWANYLQDYELEIRLFEYSAEFESMREGFVIDEWLADLESRFFDVPQS
jgi:hypothetical protein